MLAIQISKHVNAQAINTTSDKGDGHGKPNVCKSTFKEGSNKKGIMTKKANKRFKLNVKIAKASNSNPCLLTNIVGTNMIQKNIENDN